MVWESACQKMTSYTLHLAIEGDDGNGYHVWPATRGVRLFRFVLN
jgi:hypothetical protein